MKRWAGGLAALAVSALAIAVVQLLPPPPPTVRPDFPAFVMTIEEWDSARVRYADGRTLGGTAVYRLEYRRHDDWTLTLVSDDATSAVPGQGYSCRAGAYGSLDWRGGFTATSTDPAMCNGVGRWIHYGIASSYPWKRETADGRVTYTDPGERVVFVLATGLPLLYEAGPISGPVAHRTIFRVQPPTVVASLTPTQSASPTAAPTLPRASRATWAPAIATASDVLARFRTAGLNVEAQPPSGYPALFGADGVDLILIQGETAAIYTFPTTATSARVNDEAANNRLTVSYLRTPYYVQAANLLVVITTNDPKAAARMIDAITR